MSMAASSAVPLTWMVPFLLISFHQFRHNKVIVTASSSFGAGIFPHLINQCCFLCHVIWNRTYFRIFKSHHKQMNLDSTKVALLC